MDIHIPYGAYWSTPFVRWQGAFADLHALDFAAWVTASALADRGIDGAALEAGVLGLTVPQQGSFYGLPYLAGKAGLGHLAGPTVMQACATGARILAVAADEIARGQAGAVLAVAADRVSNGPEITYPNPRGPGGAGRREVWVLDNFAKDPFAGCAMIETAEAVAAENGFSLQAQHDVVLMRHDAYAKARAEGFHARFMRLPFAVPDPSFRRMVVELDGDQGVYPTTAEKLAALKPVREGGTVTYGAQTHPADGNAGLILTDASHAASLSRDPGISVRILGFGMARAAAARMPEAPVPAASRALAAAGLSIDAIDTVKTHNPFAVNDLYFAAQTGFPLERMNRTGCSLIWGHPQGPTGLRLVIELIEELAMAGGGVGLFTGCAAGDTAMAVVIRVG